jgi:hypothetical protein
VEMMDHKQARELLHLGKDLPQDKRQPLEAHLQGCPACREYAGFLGQLEHDLPASLPGVAFSQAELRRAASIISSRTRRGTMRKDSFDGVKFAAWGAAAVVLALALSWGIQNLMPQQPLPVGMTDQAGTPSTAVREPEQTPQSYPEPVSTLTPAERPMYPSAQELSLAAADLGAGWQLDAEVTDLDERYFMERGEDGRAVIWTEQKGNPLWFDLESVETISMRGFSHPEGKMVLFQVVAVFEDNAQLDNELQDKVPVCDPPCEHRNEYSDGSGEISYYRDISFGDISMAGIVTDIADPHPPFISFIFFRKDRVLVSLFSAAQPDDPVNTPPVDEELLEGFARVIEANISSAFTSSSQEVLEPSPTLSAQEFGLTTADLGEGWTLDAEISDYNTNYKFERREDGKAVIEILKKHPEPRIHPDLVDSVSWRAFSQREQNYVFGQLVIVFKDTVLAEEAIKRDMPDCTPPCEHVTDYGDSGTREIYEDIGIGDESVLTRFFALEFDSQPVMNILQFREGKVVVFLQSLPQWIYEDNWIVGVVSESLVSGERLTELSRIMEARIPSSSVSPEAPESSPTPRPDPHSERLQPSLTGELLSLAGWSPDGQWLVFWTVEPPDPGATGFVEFIYRLRLYHPETGERCRYDEVTTTGYARMLDWHSDGRWGFQQDDRFLAALPCEDPEPARPRGLSHRRYPRRYAHLSGRSLPGGNRPNSRGTGPIPGDQPD